MNSDWLHALLALAALFIPMGVQWFLVVVLQGRARRKAARSSGP